MFPKQAGVTQQQTNFSLLYIFLIVLSLTHTKEQQGIGDRYAAGAIRIAQRSQPRLLCSAANRTEILSKRSGKLQNLLNVRVCGLAGDCQPHSGPTNGSIAGKIDLFRLSDSRSNLVCLFLTHKHTLYVAVVLAYNVHKVPVGQTRHCPTWVRINSYKNRGRYYSFTTQFFF